MARKMVYADDVKDLLKGLSELPWDEEVDYLVDSLPSVEVGEIEFDYSAED